MPEQIRSRQTTIIIVYFLITACVLVIDQITKLLIVSTFNIGESLPVIKGIFHLTLVFNKGIAFGVFKNNFYLPGIVAFFVILAISIFFIRFSTGKTLSVKLGLSLILGGCIGNLIDRLNLGCVIDFLDFRIWPVFNVADSAISVGVFLLVLSVFVKHRFKNI